MNEWLKDHGTIAVTVATVIGYGVGYSTVALFAQELGVSVGDLDADLRDYLLLAGLNVVIWALAIIVLIGTVEVADWINRTFGHGRKVREGFTYFLLGAWICILFLSLTVLGLYVSVEQDFYAALDLTFSWALVVTAIGAACIIVLGARAAYLGRHVENQLKKGAVWDPGIRKKTVDDRSSLHVVARDPMVIVGWAAIVIIVSTVVTLAGSAQWARDIRDWAKDGGKEPKGPVGLALVLQPELGQVRLESDEPTMCAVRVSDRVIAGQSVIVTDDVTSFRSQACKRTDDP